MPNLMVLHSVQRVKHGIHALVFNCETFDFKVTGHIFVGLFHCGSWGSTKLSAVSLHIQTITPFHQNIGIFIMMNPGYACRVELQDNLKQLCRIMAMNKPDIELITEVLVFSQGFASTEQRTPKFVALFSMTKEALFNQTYYDFGLRAMKSVLMLSPIRRDQE